MQPALIVPLDKFPVTANGKVDTEAFPKPGVRPAADCPDRDVFRHEEERVLMQLFREVIAGRDFGLGDNLFDAGFNSIKVIEAARLLHRAYPAVIQIQDIFSYPTVGRLAGLVRERTETAEAMPEAIRVYDL
jgi:aryl carrier-like protein